MSNLKMYRESLKISQTALADIVGCTQGAIGHWETTGANIAGGRRVYHRKCLE